MAKSIAIPNRGATVVLRKKGICIKKATIIRKMLKSRVEKVTSRAVPGVTSAVAHHVPQRKEKIIRE